MPFVWRGLADQDQDEVGPTLDGCEGEVPGNGTGIIDKNSGRCAVPGCACNKK